MTNTNLTFENWSRIIFHKWLSEFGENISSKSQNILSMVENNSSFVPRQKLGMKDDLQEVEENDWSESGV